MNTFCDEYAYLIHLIKCAIHNEQPLEIPDPLWFETVYRCGIYHQVANIAFYSVKKLRVKPEEELDRKWEACCSNAVVRDFNQTYARDEIVRAFDTADIRYLEVQGTKIKLLYPQPEYRTMSDIDFIIDPGNIPKAALVLQQLGYECKDAEGDELDAFRAPNINIEVHTAYFIPSSQYHAVMRPPFSSVEQTGSYDINEFYIYNMLHIAKHYYLSGCGIRRVLDAYFLNQNYGEILNRSYINSVLAAANVQDFVRELSVLADAWFGNESPHLQRSDMARAILNAGLHGNKFSASAVRLKSIQDEGGIHSKLKFFLMRLFGTESMYARYPFLKRWWILYPVCWLHRVICFIFSKKKRSILKEINMIINFE